MAPFSRAAGRWCPLLKLQAEFPKEAFHEPERPQLPAPCCSSAGEDAGSGPSSAARDLPSWFPAKVPPCPVVAEGT